MGNSAPIGFVGRVFDFAARFGGAKVLPAHSGGEIYEHVGDTGDFDEFIKQEA